MEQPEKTEPTKTSSYNISPTGGNENVSNDIIQRVIEALDQSLKVDSTNIHVRINDKDQVELYGTVPDREMIRFAEECLRDWGITNIDNDLKVMPMI